MHFAAKKRKTKHVENKIAFKRFPENERKSKAETMNARIVSFFNI